MTDLDTLGLDHPRCRQSTVCPLCHHPKDKMLVVCWPCFRSTGYKYGDLKAHAAVDKAEARLATA